MQCNNLKALLGGVVIPQDTQLGETLDKEPTAALNDAFADILHRLQGGKPNLPVEIFKMATRAKESFVCNCRQRASGCLSHGGNRRSARIVGLIISRLTKRLP